ncbi:MAG: HAD family hydrolase [Lachnospiraceae bacterium]|nr:HAD family hydrolase [Lachnospiraceae bacterium]
MIKNILFDVDGTIWDSTAVVAKAWVKAAAELGLPTEEISAERLKKEFGKTMQDIFESIFPAQTNSELFAKLQNLLYVYEHEFLEANEEDLTYPKMRETMERLSQEYNLYIVSNCQLGYIEQVCGKTGITELIKDFTCFGETQKPKNESIEILIDRNNLVKEECVYVGDIRGDEVSAHKAGIAFAHAKWGFGIAEEPEFVADLFETLPEVLKNA